MSLLKIVAPLFLLSILRLSLALNFKLHGLDYTLRIGADWYPDEERCKDYEDAVADMNQLKAVTNNIRIFTLTDCGSGDILLRATQQAGLGLWLGLWVGPNGTLFVEEREALINLLMTQSFHNVVGIHVSSEAIFRRDLTVDQAITFRNIIKDDLVANGLRHIPVTIADIFGTYLLNPQLVTLDEYVVHFNQFPFWNNRTNINNAAEWMKFRTDLLNNTEGRQIVIGETGWADAGFHPQANPTNEPSMQKWLRDFVCMAQEEDWDYYWFIAYDSDWQRVNHNDPNGVEGHFGLFTENRELKPFFQNFSINCTEPRIMIDPEATFPPHISPIKKTMEPSPSPSQQPAVPRTTTPPTLLPTQQNSNAPSPSPSEQNVVPRSTTQPSPSPSKQNLTPPSPPPSQPIALTTMPPSNVPVPQSPRPTPVLYTKTPVSTMAPFQPSASPSMSNPTYHPSVSPFAALAPTFHPSLPPAQDRAPTLRPWTESTRRPWAEPTRRPWAEPTRRPWVEPTRSPQAGPSASSPSAGPTMERNQSTSNVTTESSLVPTAGPSIRSVANAQRFVISVKNLKLTLVGVFLILEGTALNHFINTTIAWYRSIYVPTEDRRRSLQVITSFNEFDTEIIVQNQSTNGEGNTVTYDQIVRYGVPPRGDAVAASDIVLSPFNNDTLRSNYYSQLATSDPVFANVSDSDAAPDAAFVSTVVINDGTDSTADVQEGVDAIVAGGGEAEDEGSRNLIVISGLCGLAALLILTIVVVAVRRRNKQTAEKHLSMVETDQEFEVFSTALPKSDTSPRNSDPNRHSRRDASSPDAELSTSTMDHEFRAAVAGDGNHSIVSSAAGTLGELTRENSGQVGTLKDFYSDQRPLVVDSESVNSNRWAVLRSKYTDESKIYTIEAPPGKLGVVVDTPDDGPPVVFDIKSTSPLLGLLNIGDRLLAVNDVDVTAMSAVHTSRVISDKSQDPIRKFILLRAPRNW